MMTKYSLIDPRPFAVTAILIICLWASAEAQQLAFPGAEEWGAHAKGGRGGKVLYVTTLDDTEPGVEPAKGSLRAACNAPGPRTVVFAVSGTIYLKAPISITEPYLTLAGQSAPGDGVCIANYDVRVNRTHDIIIKYLRFRPGDDVGRALQKDGLAWQTDALAIYASQDVIVDHCSASWGNDEIISLTGVNLDRVTVQWSIIAEALNNSTHEKGRHGYGSIVGGHIGHGKVARLTLHHNLWAHNLIRNPHFAGDRSGKAPGSNTDFRNNVIYDWGRLASHNYTPQYTKVNYVGNYLKPGPSTNEKARRVGLTGGSDNGHFYLEGNLLSGFPEATEDNWLFVNDSRGVTRLASPIEAPHVETSDAQNAFQQVLSEVGATLPRRDAVDHRVIKTVEKGTGRIIDTHHDVGAWAELASGEPEKDTDKDGMSDAWEMKFGLDVAVQDNNEDQDGDGYTNLEEFLNGTDPHRSP
jgi:hypothetical protein